MASWKLLRPFGVSGLPLTLVASTWTDLGVHLSIQSWDSVCVCVCVLYFAQHFYIFKVGEVHYQQTLIESSDNLY